jgi:hypothetical protein
MVMLRTGKRPQMAPAVPALTWRIHHIQPEAAAVRIFKRFYEVL